MPRLWRPLIATVGVLLTASLVYYLIFLSAMRPSSSSEFISKELNAGLDTSAMVVARVDCPDLDTFTGLASRLDVWSVDRNQRSLLAMMPRTEMANLVSDGLRVELDPVRTERLAQINRALPGQTSGIAGYPCYRTVEETYGSMRSLALQYPRLVSWHTYGHSWKSVKTNGFEGYPLTALVLSNRASFSPKTPVVIIAETHAREYVTAELALRFAERLVREYNRDPEITWLLDYHEVHIIPLVNPDGRKYAERGYPWRKNADSDYGCAFPNYGVDLNRNSSFNWGGASKSPCDDTYEGPNAASEPETKAIQEYLTTVFASNPGLTANGAQTADPRGLFITLHSFGNSILYPWGFTNQPPPYVDKLKTLAERFSALTGARVMQSYGLYATPGDTEDWVYGSFGVPGYTFEIGNDFFQDCGTFSTQLEAAWASALLFGLKSASHPFQTPAGPDSSQVGVSAAKVAQVNSRPMVELTAVALATERNHVALRPIITAARYSVDAPSWLPGVVTYPMRPADGFFDSSSENVVVNLDLAGMAFGRHSVFVESQDASGNWGAPTATFLDVTPLSTTAILSGVTHTLSRHNQP